jgi:hypothetical protein
MGVKYICDYCGGDCPESIPEGVARIKIIPGSSRDILFRIKMEGPNYVCDECWKQHMRELSGRLSNPEKPNRYGRTQR